MRADRNEARPAVRSVAQTLMCSAALVALLGMTGCGSLASLGRREPDPTVKLAGIFLHAGASDAALRASDEILAREPRNAEALATRAEALVQLGRTDEAQQAFATAIAANPSAVAPRLALGRMLVQLNPPAAEQVFAEVLRRQPGNAIALNNLGIARDLQGRHAEAQSAYRAASAADPKMTGASVNLGLSQVLAGDMADAVRTLTPLASLPDAPEAVQENLGIALAASGDPVGAARVLGRVLSPAEVTAALAQARQTVAPLAGAPVAGAPLAGAPVAAATPAVAEPAAPPAVVAAAPAPAVAPAVVAPVAVAPVAVAPVTVAPVTVTPVTVPPVAVAAAAPIAPTPIAPTPIAPAVAASAPLAAIAIPAARVTALPVPPSAVPVVAPDQTAALAVAPPAVPDAALPTGLPLGVPIAVPVAPGVPATPAAATPSGPAYAQLALASSPARARLRWDAIRTAQESLLSGRSLVLATSSYRDQPIWAVRTGPFATPREANSFCAQLLSAGQECWAMIPGRDAPARDVTVAAVEAAPPAVAEVRAGEPAPAGRAAYAQLAASDSELGVAGEWARLRRRLGPLLHDRREITLAAEVSGRTVWRLRTGPFQQPREAETFCAEVRAAGGNCWAATGS